jgi:PASTA domain-containing protein
VPVLVQRNAIKWGAVTGGQKWESTAAGLLTALVLAATCILVAAPTALAATPLNDNFANAEALNGSLPIEVAGSNVGATHESADELDVFAAGHSVWFEWTASITGWVTASTCDASFPTVLGVFSIGALGEREDKVTIGNPSEGPHCFYADKEFTFPAIAGKHYAIGVDGNGFSPGGPAPQTEGSFPLRIEATPAPPNDDFADAQALAGNISEEPGGGRFYIASTEGYNWNATTESGEPAPAGHQGGASVWYDWSAPASGTVEISASLGGSLTLEAYSGAAVGSLIPVPSTSPYLGALQFSVEAGKLYRVAVGGQFDGTIGEAPESSFSLLATMQLPPGSGYPLEAGAGPAAIAPLTAPLESGVPGCVVPNLDGKKLKAARRGLTRADCKLGKVIKKKGAAVNGTMVVSQSPKAGKVLAGGSKIGVRLGN